jgi:hypothetical protein
MTAYQMARFSPRAAVIDFLFLWWLSHSEN